MRVVTSLALLFLMYGCATGKIEKFAAQITWEDTAWIQKGITTRTEVEAQFGSPNFEVPEYAGSTHEASASSKPRSDKDSPTTKGIVSQSPEGTKATYVHPLSEAEISPSYATAQTQQDRFWVKYDEANVVKDFGFTVPPPTPPTARTNGEP